MSQFMYRVLAWITALVVSGGVVRTEAPVGPEISAPSAVLMEASTGQIIYEKNGEEQRSPASITKIMTLILIFDAIDSGKISLSDQVGPVPMPNPWEVPRCFWKRGKCRRWRH